MRKRRSFNPKRRIRSVASTDYLTDLAKRVIYGGNPEHKRNPGDFGLTPPSQPRPDKTLCDEVGIYKRSVAQSLLRRGVEKGLISENEHNGYPQNIWSVTQDNQPMEAELENREQGAYHGYPVPSTDPLREEILARWNST